MAEANGTRNMYREEEEKIFQIVSTMDPTQEGYIERINAIAQMQRLNHEEQKMHLEEQKLILEEQKLEEEHRKTKWGKVGDVLKAVVPALGSLAGIGLIILAEKKDDLFLGSKAMGRVPRP